MGHFHPLFSMSWNGSLSLNSFPAGRMPTAEGVGHKQTHAPQQKSVAVGTHVSSRAHRVAGGSCPPPAPTERSVRIYRTTLFGRCSTALQEPATPHVGG